MNLFWMSLSFKATVTQSVSIFQLLADELQFKIGVDMTVARLEEDGFPSYGPPAFTCHVAERPEVPGVLVGICFHYMTYSAHAGRTVYLEDLYVVAECRGGGLGTRLLAAMADWALERGCCRINYMVSDSDEAAKRFYHRLGAVDLTAMGWRLHRIWGDALHRLADGNRQNNGDSAS